MTVHFTLKRKGWGYEDIYEALKTGAKTSEYRDASPFWISRLFTKRAQSSVRHNMNRHKGRILFTHPDDHKHTEARFVVGYTKYPRLIADIHNIFYLKYSNQFEIQIKNVREELGP